ncbi:unnamed protein product [Phaeothamnion confervicola]
MAPCTLPAAALVAMLLAGASDAFSGSVLLRRSHITADQRLRRTRFHAAGSTEAAMKPVAGGRSASHHEYTPMRMTGPKLQRKVQANILKGLISFAAFTLGAPVIGGAVRTHHGGDGAAVRAGVAEAGILTKRFDKRTLKEKLSNVPVFMVVSREGQPYLTPSPSDDSQMAVIYTCVEDAEEMTSEMLQSPYLRGQCRVLVMSLDKAYNLVSAPAKPMGGARGGRGGGADTLKYVFHPSVAGRERAAGLGLADAVRDVPVPVYYAEGIQVVRNGVPVKPLFLDSRDLFDAWFRARRENPSMPRNPSVRVFSLPEVILRMEEAGGEYADFGFFPPTASMKFVSAVKKGGGSTARIPAPSYEY